MGWAFGMGGKTWGGEEGRVDGGQSGWESWLDDGAPLPSAPLTSRTPPAAEGGATDSSNNKELESHRSETRSSTSLQRPRGKGYVCMYLGGMYQPSVAVVPQISKATATSTWFLEMLE